MLKVVVGIIFNADGEVFINQRRTDTFMEGYWEFPGGKIKKGESPLESLIRELKEELAITVTNCSHQLDFSYHYPNKSVMLHVFMIHNYEREIQANEGQNIQFVGVHTLKEYLILPTVMPIINKICLSSIYHIKNYHLNLYEELVEHISHIQLLQLRSKEAVSIEDIKRIFLLCNKHNVTFIINVANLKECMEYCHGIHLTSSKLMLTTNLLTTKLISVSTHCKKEIIRANEIGADIITLSPVKHTTTHPQAIPLGYEKAKELSKESNSVVYFLGGMSTSDFEDAKHYGAYGIAGISKL